MPRRTATAPVAYPYPGERIRAARKAAGLTQAKLAAAVGCHVQTISAVERGDPRYRLPAGFLMAIERATGGAIRPMPELAAGVRPAGCPESPSGWHEPGEAEVLTRDVDRFPSGTRLRVACRHCGRTAPAFLPDPEVLWGRG